MTTRTTTSDIATPRSRREKVARRALIRTGGGPAAVTLLATLVAVSLLGATVAAAASSLDLLHGWPWLLAAVYMFAALFACAAGLGPHRRILRAAQHADHAGPSWKRTFNDLNDRGAWLVRVGTVPLVPLATVRLAALNVPVGLAIAFAIVGWLSFDILTLITVPARRTLLAMLRLLRHHPSPGTAR